MTPLKRKGSPIDEEEQSAKRRFAESESIQEENVPLLSATTPNESATPSTTTTAPAQDPRAARFAALKSRIQASREANLHASQTEAQRQKIDISQLPALNRKRDIAAHNLLKAEVEARGEDFERKRAWDWTIEESERWDKRLAKKAKNRENNLAFRDYADEANKIYKRQVGQMTRDKTALQERKEQYKRDKQEEIDRAVASGGLELVETLEGEVIAVDKYGGGFVEDSFKHSQPSKEAVDRLVKDLEQAEEVRLRKRRERNRDEKDVTYINEKNKQFNLKLRRFYDKYTTDIRESFERGTAL
ncbi:SYF2-domain-containing protein [Piedraia hortae CBS 480.64]|uniref:Pre-mRNA-splicing factor SYF2 n=1 Tax=Piedraia hortae CBS 480.64 TaxID=1314780 RepID=A0A6A7BSW1_9PEZI|nr:SYF2-domain-containing protein [Piedraia hortae CBS 480.64]